MFPRCSLAPTWPNRCEWVSAIDADKVATSNMKRQFFWDAPLVAQKNVRESGVHAHKRNVCRKTCGIKMMLQSNLDIKISWNELVG